ncbi:APOB isoform 2 [Pongo abelii]|uniref:Apolipoprotein B-100 n=1 Tax=Pongo abelii TaxID=9601 RepID=A0A2J8VMD4_PONAB|nr:APOB isoform 2 [Pongo abelii]
MGPPRPALLALPALLLLLAGARAGDATRFKHLRKYTYNYEAESSSGVPGTADSRSATRINCKVELEVPQLCSFILKTSQCTLKEVYGFNPEGKALLKKTKNSEEFAAAMSRYELKLAIPEGKQVFLYPEKDEPTYILNIKRGIISALLVPPETEEAKQVLFLDTVYGNCSTHFTVKTRKGNVATEISTERDLGQCDRFKPIRTGISPLALIKGMTRPLSTLISSSQSCQYTLDAKRKHVAEAICKEQHLFLPFSYKNKYGMVAQVTQTFKLEDTPKINSRFFGEGTKKMGLAFESTKSTSPPKQAEAVLKTLQELKKLTISEQNIQRANLFSKLVTELRGLSDEAVTSLLPQLIEVSSPITLQALVQCGQPQCSTHILRWLKRVHANPLLIDVVTYLVALIPEPSAQQLREIFNMARDQRSRATLYALSHAVNNYRKTNPTGTQELLDIANYLMEQIQDECTGDEDYTYLILRVIGNMGQTMEQLTPELKSSILKCVQSTKPSLMIQKAAIQALRKMEPKDKDQEVLLQTVLDDASPGDKRLAAYLMLMRSPSQADINKIVQLLPREQNEQVKNFVASHIANILNSEELDIQDLKKLVKEALKESQLPTVMDFRKFSRNYQLYKSVSLPSLDPVSAKIEGNLIFDPNNYLPKESMLKTTLTAFGFASADLIEIGLEGKGFEPTLEALFGKQGFFPDSVNKALYWVNGQVPDGVSKVLVDHFGYTKDDKHEQDMVNGMMLSVEKLIKDLKSKEVPEARAYLRILGEELGFARLHDLQLLGQLLLMGARTLQGIPQVIGEVIRKGSKNDFFLHYIFMENAFELPTGAGLQLQISSSGVIAPGTKAGVKLEVANMQAELVAKPSVSVEFVTNMGIIIPDFARSGVQMNTNFFHESGLEAHVALKAGQLKFIIPSPKRPVKLLSGGLELELRPTGEIEQYSVSATYELQREDRALVDTLKFVTQAEGAKQTEATMTFKYNRQSMTLSSEVQIPDFDVDLGTILRVNDESTEGKTSYRLTLDIQNKKITEVALMGHLSDGRVKYTLNKNSLKIEIPLPFGGKSSRDLKMLETVRTPALHFKSVGFHLPSREFQVPTFTIPKLYQLQVPLLGVLDLSTNVYSNLYNWSASYSGGNTSTDHFSLQARYHMKADSVVDLLSYNVQGSGETTYDHKNTFTLSCDGSLRHKFLDSNIKFSHVEKLGNNPVSKGLLTFDASSSWGPQMSASVHLDSKKKQHLFVKEVKIDGQFRVSSFYAKGTYGLSCQRDPNTGRLNGESNLRFNSSYLQGTNQITGRYEDGTLSLTSTSDLQSGIIKNTASLKYENYELTLKSDTNGKYKNFATSNKMDMTFSKQNALLRSEYQADYESLRFFSLLSGSLNSHGLELNADILGTDKINSGAHKATLRIGQDGISTSATTNLKYSLLVLENELNAELGLSGASMKLTTNGRFREHNAKFSLDGKAALTELSLGSAYQAMILGVDSKNIFNFKISQEGLKLSNDMMGSYAEMKFDHTNSLNIAGLSLDFSSKLDNIYSSDKFYKQTVNLQLQPYSLVTTLNSDLKYNALDLTNNGKLRLEPLKLHVAGNLKGAYQNNEIKHIYAISSAALSASYKADTVAKVQGVEFSHRLNTDIAGLASAIDMSTNYNSDSLHFSNVFRSVMAPFTMTIDAHTNGNGKLTLWGEHTGQLYSKFLLKAEPLAFTFSHDYKGSTSHHLVSRKSISAALEHKVSALLTPAEQTGTWKLKTQFNNNEYSQDLDAYNTKDKIGVELSGRTLADLTLLDSPIKVPLLLSEPINIIDALEMRDAVEKPQEFTIVAFVKYDKNQDVHAINLPFFETLQEYFERNQQTIIVVLENIQRDLKHINIDQFVRKYRAALGKLPQQANDYLNSFNWERQVSRAKEKLTALTKKYRITENDIQIALDDAKINFNEKLSQLQTYMIQFDQYIKDNYDLHDLKIAIANIIDEIIEKLKSLDEHYHIRVNLVKTVHDLHLFIENIDFNKSGSSTASWIQNVDTKYQIRIQIQEKLQQLKRHIQNIDIQHLAGKLKQHVEAIDVRVLLDQLGTTISFERINDILEHVKHFVINLIGDFEVAEKISAFRAKVHELIERYEVDQQIQVLMDKLVELAHQYKLKETIQKLSNVLQQVKIKDYFEKLVGFIDDAVKQLNELSFKTFIEDVNKFLDMLIKKLKSFDYHQFVDETNNKIREVTQRLNGEIQALELPQKAEALKLFLEETKATVAVYLESLQDTKITLIIDWLQEALSSASLAHMKAKFRETLEDTRDRMYQMDIQQELQRYLSLVGQVYSTLVTYISDWWTLAAKNLTDFAEQYSIQDWAKRVKALVEQGFTVPEIKTILGTMPAFEVSLQALQKATFQTPDFIVPLTDLRIPSVQINFKELKNIKIPSRFSTPEFTIFNTFHIPSFTIDFVEIKVKIIRTIDQMLNSELQWPVPDVYLRDLKVEDFPLMRITLPDFHLPEIAIPEFIIPNLNLNDFQVPDLHIPEFQLPHISHTIEVPTFGKLYSILKIQSPLFTLDANADIGNGTTSANEAGIAASITAKGESKLEVLNFDFQANAQLSNPKINPLALKESVKFSSKYLRTEHGSEMLFFGNAIEGKSNTVASLHTEKNTLELSNGVIVKINNRLTLDSNTKYFHKLNIPKLDFSSQADLRNEIKTLLEAGHITWTSSGKGSWKWACPRFSDEGTHESQISFTIEGPLTSFGLSNKINSKHLRVNQNLVYESGSLNFSKLEIQSQVDSQHVGRSVLTAKGTALFGEGKAEFTGRHDAHLNGKVIGSLKNSLFFSAQPFEITASTNNEGNLKVSFPLKLTGKIDFLNNYALFLSPSAQQASWQVSARFNQYKYNQNFSAGNNENIMEAHVGINGEANLDFLNIPLTIPEMRLPYTIITTPPLKDFSLWEKTGLKEFLKTTKQSFDLSVKAQYKKNKHRHSITNPLAVLYEFISQSIKSFDRHFEKARNNALDYVTKSYNETKIKFDKYKAEKSHDELPKTFQIPGYTVPVVNVEVSPFTIEMSAFGYVFPKAVSMPSFTILGSDIRVPSYTLMLPSLELPVLHVPRNLKVSLPDFKELCTISHIFIPAMGNITYDFSFKSSVITLNTNAELFNQSDIVAHLLSSSSSVIDTLQYKLEGTTRLTRKRGLKLATALSLSNKFVEGSHNSTVSLTKKNMEASVATTAKAQIPILRMNFKQELNGNTKSKPTVSSSMEFKYDFNSSMLYSTAKGAVDHKLSLESLTSYFSIESSTKGDVKGSVLSREYSGTIASEANTYLNSKSTRSSVKLQGTSKIDDTWNLEVKENFAGEATLQRIYSLWEHSMKNHLQLEGLFFTNGEHTSKATLELSPWEMSALVQVHASQPSSFLDFPHLGQEVALNANTKNQKIRWKNEVRIHSGSFQSHVELSNDQEKAHLDIVGSLEGHLRFLKNIILPVYDKSLWDFLKLDVTTSIGRRQHLRVSTAFVYTKNPNGYSFSIPVKVLADKFIIPGLKLNDLNSVLVMPTFHVPFTDLQVPSYKLDFREIKIYKKLRTSSFALNLPTLPEVKFPEVDVLTKYSQPEDSLIPFFEITVPESQLTVSQFTLPKSVSVGIAALDLNAVANKITDFELPTIIVPEKTIEIPSIKFSVPAGIVIPSFQALTAHFEVDSPLYNATWSASLKNKADHVETVLDSTCSSTVQFLKYELNVVGTHKIEDGMLASKTKGTFAHRDFSTEYEEDGKYEGLQGWEGKVHLNIKSPVFTDLHLRYQKDKKGISTSAASPAIGTVGMDMDEDDDFSKWNFYYSPQSSPDKKLTIFKTELRVRESDEETQIKVNWEEEAASGLLTSLKDNVPKATRAFYDYVNKYHWEHTGLTLTEASSKLRRNLQNNAEWVYQGAIRQIDDIDMRFQKAASGTTGTYQEWKDKAQNLYQELLTQEGQASFQGLKDKVFDGLVRVTQEFHMKVKHLIDSLIDFLNFPRFQFPGKPGTYTREELCTMFIREVGTVLSQVYSKVHNGSEILFSYFQDLVITLPFELRRHKLIDVISMYRELLKDLSKEAQEVFKAIQSLNSTEVLRNLQDLLQFIFQLIEDNIKQLKEMKFTYLINYIQDEINTIFKDYIPYVFKLLKENLCLNLRKFNEFIQNELQEASQELQQIHQYIMALREEYFDPSIVGWTVKYYELEEKIVSLIKNLLVALKDFHSEYIVSASDFTSQLSSQVEEFLHRNIQEYLSILTDPDGKGKEKIAELSTTAQEIIKSQAIATKEIISDCHQQFRYKLQDFSDQLSDYYEKFIAESKRLIDLSIQNYHTFLIYITELLKKLQSTAVMNPYMKLAPGELTIIL